MALAITTRGGARIQGTAADLRGLADTLAMAVECGHGFTTDEAQIVLLDAGGKPALPRRPGVAGAGPPPASRALRPAPEPDLEAEQPDNGPITTEPARDRKGFR